MLFRSQRCYVIAGEKALPLRAGMNRRHRLLSVRGEALGALHAFPYVSDAARPRPCRDNRTNSDASDRRPTVPRRDTSVSVATQVPPNPPTNGASPEETTGSVVSRIGVTATWHGQWRPLRNGVNPRQGPGPSTNLKLPTQRGAVRAWESSFFRAGRMSKTTPEGLSLAISVLCLLLRPRPEG